jgi:hypothetical protein
MRKVDFGRRIALGLCVVASGCVADELELGVASQEVAVAWTNAVGVTATGNSLTKTAATGWGNAGASSTAAVSGDAYVEFSTGETNRGKSIGLSAGDANQDHADIDFSIHLSGNGSVYVYEAGIFAGQFGTYATSDVFRVESVERQVSYLRNGTAFYTSARVPSYPLVVDSALFHTGATINNVDAGALVFRNVVGVTATGTMLTKTAADGWGNAGAFSVRAIRAGDGYVEFSTNENNRGKTVGLSLVDASQHHNSVKWGIHLSGNTSVQIYELGALRGTFGTYVANDVFRVEVVGSQVRYVKNGTAFYTSAVAPSYPMFFDAALFHLNTTVKNIVVDDTFWTSVAGADAIGSKLVGTAATGWGNAGAVTLQSIAAGTGYVEFSPRETDHAKALGLTHASLNENYTDIDFAISFGVNGMFYVHERGVQRGVFGAFATTDVFRVAINALGAVEYRRNGTVFYTSATAPVYPLVGDAALHSHGATFKSVTIVDSP